MCSALFRIKIIYDRFQPGCPYMMFMVYTNIIYIYIDSMVIATTTQGKLSVDSGQNSKVNKWWIS